MTREVGIASAGHCGCRPGRSAPTFRGQRDG